MDLNTLFARLLPRLWLIVALAALGGLAGFAFSRFATPVYASEARLLVGQTLDSSQVDYSDLLASQLLAQTYADLAGTSPILGAAGSTLQPPMSAADVSHVTSARAPVGSVYVVISAEASDGPRAAAIANAVATALAAAAPTPTETDDQLQAAITGDLAAVDEQVTTSLAEIGRLSALSNPSAEDVQRLEVLQARVETLRTQRATLASGIRGPGPNTLTVVEPASPPTEAFQPRTLVNASVGALVGAVIAIGFVLLRSSRRGVVPAGLAAATD